MFHERITPLLQAVFAQYGPRNTPKIYRTVLQPCRRLLQKCSCKSVADMSRYCTLAYWLYLYGNKQAALALCEAVHGVDFPFEFGYWQGGIQNIYGLEIRIARELFGEDRRKILPPALLDYFCSKSVKKAMRYPQVISGQGKTEWGLPEQVLLKQLVPKQVLPEQGMPEQVLLMQAPPEQVMPEQVPLKLAPPEQERFSCDSPLREAEMLRVLFRLIGHGETGLFPELERHRAEIEQTICLYTELLKSE